ncbi:hypothetical protein V6N11_054427 [Hibiscus sabdariffa]|uniref:Cleavage inducing molecular chaperone Jiv domain-containing protein n=1 Tax=Hibiscus sabdariffa TaxID=183260 RepID=A0ABR2S431_9ROSI
MHGGAAEDLGQSVSFGNNSGVCIENANSKEESSGREQNEISPDRNFNLKHKKGVWGCLSNGFHLKNAMNEVDFSDTLVVRNARALAVSTLKVISHWLERQRPILISLTTNIYNARDHVKAMFERLCPIVLEWLLNFGNIVLLLSIIWLDCTLRGIDSLLRMGTTSLFLIMWCSIFSVIAMVGMVKFLIMLAIAALTAVFVGFSATMLVVAVFGTISLWFLWKFLDDTFCDLPRSREHLALLVATIYFVYCAWMCAGWLGFLLALNLAFLSSDALIYYLKSHIDQQARPDGNPEQTNGMHGHPGFFNGESVHASFSESVPESAENRSPGVASSSGNDTVITSEDEVARLLNYTDHYSALGLSRYQNVDILLDSLRRKEYDAELRREELLNSFRRMVDMVSFPQDLHSQRPMGMNHLENLGESPAINVEYKDFHQAKDGDGWVEQSLEPLLFGFLQRVEAPSAYVCADSKILDGMRCPPNTHKPTFHVNTSVTSKNSTDKGPSSGQRGGTMPMPNLEETMTEEKLLVWLQNAVQGGMFDTCNAATSAESPFAKSGSGSKSGSTNGNNRKKKGKKQ